MNLLTQIIFFWKKLKKNFWNKLFRSSLSQMICEIGDFKNWQNSQQNTCTGASLLIKWPCCRCFSVSFAKFLRTPCFTDRLQTSPSDISVALFDYNSQSILLQSQMSYYFVLWDINIFRKQSNASSLEETKDPYLIF